MADGTNMTLTGIRSKQRRNCRAQETHSQSIRQPEVFVVELSIVVPLFNEFDNVPELVSRLTTLLDSLGRSYEIILVDDGSRDGTATAISQSERESDGKVIGVYLARNYGQTTAMQAGFDRARAAIVVSMDGDLQNDPADIPRLLQKLESNGVDVVSGWRRNRQDDAIRVWVSKIANRLIGWITGVAISDYGCSLRVYRRERLEQIRIYGEMHRFLPVLLAEVGATMIEIEVTHQPRKRGQSKYGIDRTFRVLLDLLLVKFMQKYLQRPLHFFGWLGFSTMIPGGLIFLYLCSIWLFAGEAIGSRPLLLVSVFLMLAGTSFFGQGLLAEILVRVLLEGTSRTQYQLRSTPPAPPPTP
jgi:glycosyltransferase involved in cell wall biosynthesis